MVEPKPIISELLKR